MPYRVIEVESGLFVRSLITELPYEFDTGAEASAFSKQLAADTSGKYRVKKVLNANWRRREQERMDNGFYEPLPWEGQDWWHDSKVLSIRQYQYPHPSKKEPGKIAYVESEEKGMDNIKTRVKPGRYLEQFRDIFKLYRLDLQREAAKFTVMYEPRTLRIADTEDDIQWVYENGPPSCMSTYEYRKEHGWGWGTKGSWPLDTHATRVYAAGDLVVAYIVADEEEPRKKKGVLARALIWPAKKTYSRPYGEELALRKLLEKEGYIAAAPIGAKLKRVQIEKHRFLCPYIDAGQQSGGGSLGVYDHKTHLEIVAHRTPFSYCANATSGATGPALDARGAEAVPHICHRCNSDCLDAAPVYTSGTDHLWYCGSCRAEHTRQCACDNRFYSTEHMQFVEMHDGRLWSQRAFNSRGFTCQATEKRYPRELSIKLITGELWCTDYAAKHARRCMYTNQFDRTENMVKVYDSAHREMWFCKDAAVAYTFLCAVCQEHQWDTGIWAGGKEKSGPFVCKPCQKKAAPPGKATVQSLASPVQQPQPASAEYPPGHPIWDRVTIFNGGLITVRTFYDTYGFLPQSHYTIQEATDIQMRTRINPFSRWVTEDPTPTPTPTQPYQEGTLQGAGVAAPPSQQYAELQQDYARYIQHRARIRSR